MSIQSKKNKHRWELETSNEKHEITVKMGSASREPIEIYVDRRYVATVKYSGSSLIPSMEYKFLCGDETVMLVLHGSEIDMVYQGKLIHKKIEYNPTKVLPVGFRILAIILSFAAFSEFWILEKVFHLSIDKSNSGIALIMMGACAVISLKDATSPFMTKKKKILSCLFFVLWAWILTFLIIVLLI